MSPLVAILAAATDTSNSWLLPVLVALLTGSLGGSLVTLYRYRQQGPAERESMIAAAAKEAASSLQLALEEHRRDVRELREQLQKANERIARLETDLKYANGNREKLERDLTVALNRRAELEGELEALRQRLGSLETVVERRNVPRREDA